MLKKNRPSGVTVDNNERRVSITWQDNHESFYSFEHLRRMCPCAECKDRPGRDETKDHIQSLSSDVIDQLSLSGAEAVGAYAIQFKWSDGHSAGIYSWEMLRNKCLCGECSDENE